MIKRFTLPEMGNLWTDLHKKSTWHKVESAGLWAKATMGEFPMDVYDLARKVRITRKVLARADELEKRGDHDLIAFILAVTELLDDMVKPHYHTGLTSFDTEDTALALILRDCLSTILPKLKHLRDVVFERAIEHKYTLQIGRTHFVHAEPITFGFKLLGWVDVLDRHIRKLEDLAVEIGIGKFSGAVGMYTLDPEIERLACEHLGLRPAKISTQIISRDILSHYTATLAAVANSLDRFATEIRLLSGTDICEVAEFKEPGAHGSSAMPCKSELGNPIKSENTCGLARISRGYLTPAFECEVVWCERTLENSAAERIYLPDLSIIIDFMLTRFTKVMHTLVVFPAQMERNIWKTGGMVFAQRVMIALTQKGMHRHEAYDILETLGKKVEHGTFVMPDGSTFRDLVYGDFTIAKLLSREELDDCFDPKTVLKHVDTIFARFVA
ncbi:MAG: adenylosuccinate lyase [Patescibacteria group bacterium]|nr:adenylosuccinate lyase [Patescibacteria group bacterium]